MFAEEREQGNGWQVMRERANFGIRACRSLQVMARTLGFIFGKKPLESFEQGGDITKLAFAKTHVGSLVEGHGRRGDGRQRNRKSTVHGAGEEWRRPTLGCHHGG